MEYFLVVLVLILHLWVWGAGAAILLMPQPWRRHWPVFCAPMGLALQSAVVWAGAYANLAGTDVYARWSEVIPLLLLAGALWRHGSAPMGRALSRYWALGLMTAVDACLLALPMALASRTLTTSSLGSCDAADYAAGARVLQEFARSDRSGFLGLTEVVRVASVDNFFDFWLRLNHFTPSALIAFNGAVFGWHPHEITGLMTVLLVATALPAVYWLARTVLRHTVGTSLWIAAIYGCSPITWYAVAHVAMGQLLAAQAIVFLTWAGLALWRGRLGWAQGGAMAGVLAVAYWLVLGSYNFIVVVCLVPALAYAGGGALLTGAWRKFGRWLVVMLAPLVVTGAVFAERTLGLVERFQLFGKYDFGWHIPVLSPEGWLGAVSGTGLSPMTGWVRLLLAVLLLVMLVAALARDFSRRSRTVFAALALTLPILAGYGYLQVRGALLGTNASYDAYKLLAVFFPAQLCGYFYWAGLTRSPRAGWRWTARTGIAVVTVLNLVVAFRFMDRMQSPPLIVDRALIQLQRIESMPRVTSLNMEIGDFWTRLWANAFLLKKPQYFRTHTYEGRINTELKGEWDLSDGMIAIATPRRGDSHALGRTFNLIRHASPYYLQAELGEGWYGRESLRRAERRWHWSQGNATLRVTNPQAEARTVTLRLWARSLAARELEVWRGDQCYGRMQITERMDESIVPGIVLPPGASTLRLVTRQEPTPGTEQDERVLGFAAYEIVLAVEPLAGDRPR